METGTSIAAPAKKATRQPTGERDRWHRQATEERGQGDGTLFGAESNALPSGRDAVAQPQVRGEL